MDNVGTRIAETRRSRRTTQAQLARKAGVSQSYISYIEKGSRRLEVGLLRRIASALEISPEVLLADGKGKGAARRAPIPILGKVAAGVFAFLEDGQAPLGLSASGEYLVDSTIHDDTAFGAVVAGDSMSPRFNEGDRVIFSPAEAVRNGDFVLAKIDHERGTFKQIFYDDEGGVRLTPLNPNHKPIETRWESLAACYKLVRRIERID